MTDRSGSNWVIAVAAGFCLTGPALADDEFSDRPVSSTVLFGSLETGPSKTFAAIGVKRAFGDAGLDAGGFRSMVKVGLSREQARRRPPHGTAYKLEGQSLIGYEWRLGSTFLALYGGTDYEIEQRPCGCGTITIVRFGQRIQADLWATPLPETTLQASAYASTIDGRLWGRLAGGWTLPQNLLAQPLQLGPEAEFFRQRDYRKLRLGLQLAGIRLLGLNWRLSAGWQRTSDRPSEIYATLGLHWRN